MHPRVVVAVRPDMLKAMLRYAAVVYAMAVINCFADDRAALLGDPAARSRELPDIGFEWVPFAPQLEWLIGALALMQTALLVDAVLCSDNRQRLATVFLDMHALFLALRCTTVAVTVLPTPVDKWTAVHSMHERSAPLWMQPAYHIVRGDPLNAWRHDLMFSGHIGFAVLAAQMVSSSLRGRYGGRAIAWLNVACSAAVLLATRVHYTADIVVGAIVAVLIFRLFCRRVRLAFASSTARIVVSVAQMV